VIAAGLCLAALTFAEGAHTLASSSESATLLSTGTETLRPGIAVTAHASKAELTSLEDTATITYSVTNTGDLALRDIEISDPYAAEVLCPVATLPSAASMECESTWSNLTAADDSSVSGTTTVKAQWTLDADATADSASQDDATQNDNADDVHGTVTASTTLSIPLAPQQDATASGTPLLAITGEAPAVDEADLPTSVAGDSTGTLDLPTVEASALDATNVHGLLNSSVLIGLCGALAATLILGLASKRLFRKPAPVRSVAAWTSSPRQARHQ
jgi:hypothetical protein